MQMSAETWQCALDKNKPVSYHQVRTDKVLNLYLQFLNKAVNSNLLSIKDDKLSETSEDRSALPTEDRKMVEVVDITWGKYTEACCVLALAEAAWKSAENEDDVAGTERQRDVTASAEPAATSSGADTQSDAVKQGVDTFAGQSRTNDELQAEIDAAPPCSSMPTETTPTLSTDVDVGESAECMEFDLRTYTQPATPPTGPAPQSTPTTTRQSSDAAPAIISTEALDAFIDGFKKLNHEMSGYLKGRE